MTRLLVSVRSVDEALLAAELNVDLIDVKEPTRGPLGMADANVRREIGGLLGTRCLLSAACGELLDYSAVGANSYDPADWAGYRYAKIGLAGCGTKSNWRAAWLTWRATLPTWIEPVLVSYADSESCDAPCYDELRSFAGEIEIGKLLFDTWDKSGPSLPQLWPAAKLLQIGRELRQDGIEFVLAGKLVFHDVPTLAKCGASFLGIRGAVCDAAIPGEDIRCGKLSAAKTKNFLQFLKAQCLDMSSEQTAVDS